MVHVWMWSVAHSDIGLATIVSPDVVSLSVVLPDTLVPTPVLGLLLIHLDAQDFIGFLDSETSSTDDIDILALVAWSAVTDIEVSPTSLLDPDLDTLKTESLLEDA